MDENMSNLTSAISNSNEASISSSSNNNMSSNSTNIIYPQQNINNHNLIHSSFASPSDINLPAAPKKRRNLPGNPDPDAEVVALSPRSLMATNRFVCDVCNKGFQRDQNLQLHRRGHNLPWKLKQRSKQEVIRKKVYVCPETSCVHHDPSRALGDLTGIKKHFSRKHGEKKWKCDKCSKRYAVQSDWKAHSKICGTREYRCDCGTLFSRRDSFITHRAFCDALAQESSRSMTQHNPLFLSSQTAPNNHQYPSQQIQYGFVNNNDDFMHHHHPLLIPTQLKQETPNSINLPPWLSSDQPGAGTPPPPPPPPQHGPLINPLFTSSRVEQSIYQDTNPNNNNNNNNTSLMSATALLQKAAQMGVTMSGTNNKIMHYQSSPSDQSQSASISRPHHHVGAPGFGAAATSAANTAGLLPSREENNNNNNNNMGTGNIFVHGLASFGHRGNANVTGGCMRFHDTNMVSSSLPSTSGGAFDGSSLGFEDSFNQMLNTNKRSTFNSFQENAHLMMSLRREGGGGGGAGGGAGDGLTRDFLGLRAFPEDHRDFLNMAGFDQMGSTPYDHHQVQNQGPWQS